MVGHQNMTSRIAIGVGCRLGCAAASIEALVRQALDLLVADAIEVDAQASATVMDRSDRATAASTLPQQVARTRRAMMVGADPIGLFTIRDKSGEPGLIEAANRLGLDLVPLSREALRDQAPFLTTSSVRTESLFGVPAVAEAAALAGAGAGSVLIIPRIATRDATCAIAATRDHSP